MGHGCRSQCGTEVPRLHTVSMGRPPVEPEGRRRGALAHTMRLIASIIAVSMLSSACAGGDPSRSASKRSAPTSEPTLTDEAKSALEELRNPDLTGAREIFDLESTYNGCLIAGVFNAEARRRWMKRVQARSTKPRDIAEAHSKALPYREVHPRPPDIRRVVDACTKGLKDAGFHKEHQISVRSPDFKTSWWEECYERVRLDRSHRGSPIDGLGNDGPPQASAGTCKTGARAAHLSAGDQKFLTDVCAAALVKGQQDYQAANQTAI